MDKKVKKKVLQQIPYGAYIVGTQTEDGKDWLMFGNVADADVLQAHAGRVRVPQR